jgi:hypothetical protein
MTELLHLSALLPTAFGVCCTVGGRRRGRLGVGFDGVAAVVMLLAMADVVVGLGLVAPILWVAGLVGLALALPLVASAASPGALVSLVDDAIPQAEGQRSHRAAHTAVLHSSLGLIVMAGLVALMSAGHTATVPTHHGVSGMLPVLVLSGSAAYVGYSTWRAAALFRMPPRRDLVGCLEAASMAASVALMAGALAV